MEKAKVLLRPAQLRRRAEEGHPPGPRRVRHLRRDRPLRHRLLRALIAILEQLREDGVAVEVNGELDENTREAIAAFQSAQDLDVTGADDDATREKLVEVYGA